jgi:putative CocE/NonD family hydrolase
MLHLGGWYDVFLEGTLENFVGLSQGAATPEARAGQKLVVGPWYHNPWHQHGGGVDFGVAARSPVDALQVLWLDRHLRGQSNQLDQEPPVAVFVMGENRWRFADAWPPPEARAQTLFLRSTGRANSLNGTGRLSPERGTGDCPDMYVYDPTDPVPSLGGHSCCVDALTPMGAADQRAAEVRMDVLVYTSDVLDQDLLVIGPVDAVLFAASTAVDTDFTVKLVDVHPDGRAINVADGVIRARFRDSLSAPTPIQPDRIYEYRIRVGSTAMRFAAGHCLRIEVSSSNFPAIDRNSNTGKRLCELEPSDWEIATQTVFHDERYPSRVILPVI